LTRLHAASSAAPALQHDELLQVPQLMLAKRHAAAWMATVSLASVRAGSTLNSGDGAPSCVSRRTDEASVV
jgi:hypothetical protein